jgi:hypothetical protein
MAILSWLKDQCHSHLRQVKPGKQTFHISRNNSIVTQQQTICILSHLCSMNSFKPLLHHQIFSHKFHVPNALVQKPTIQLLSKRILSKNSCRKFLIHTVQKNIYHMKFVRENWSWNRDWNRRSKEETCTDKCFLKHLENWEGLLFTKGPKKQRKQRRKRMQRVIINRTNL